MATYQWQPSPNAVATVLAAELNSFAGTGPAGAAVLGASAVPNGAAGYLDQYADLEVALAAPQAAHGANAVVEVYLVRSLDGAAFQDAVPGSGWVAPTNGFVGTVALAASGAAQRALLPGVLLPPQDFKLFLVFRNTGTLAASGNAVRLLRYREQVN